jgi:hypothetical protein
MNALSFYKKEWELWAAFMFGYQKMATDFYDDGHTRRPWIPMERIEMAFKAIEAKNFQFKATKYDKINNVFITFSEPPTNEVRECKRIFDGIMNGDLSVLSECFDRVHNLCESLGFERAQMAPTQLEKPKGVMDIDDLMKEPAKTVTEVPVEVIVAKPVVQTVAEPKAEETAVDPGHAEVRPDGEVVELLTPLEKARAAKKAKALGLQAPEKVGPGAPVVAPKV